MENLICPSAADLVKYFLVEKLPTHSIELLIREASTCSYEVEISVDGVGIGEINNTKLFLLNPDIDECVIVDLTNPDSLDMLFDCVSAHLSSRQWGVTMRNRSLSVHRSSIGYKKIFV